MLYALLQYTPTTHRTDNCQPIARLYIIFQEYSMQRVKLNDKVTVMYEGHLNNGEIFESSEESGPLSFTVGQGEVMPAFEEALLDMAINETKNIRIPAEKAYGLKNKELIQTVSRKVFGNNTIRPGMVVAMPLKKDGEVHKVPAQVSKIEKNKVTVDFNHPLAGQELVFQILLKEIASPEANDSPADPAKAPLPIPDQL